MRLRPPRRGPEPDDTTRTTLVDEAAAPPPVVEEERLVPPRRPPPPLLWPWLLLLLLLVIGGLAAAYFLTRDNDNGGKQAATSVTVPRVVGLKQDTAVQRVQERGLTPETRARPSRFPRGTVFAQAPAPGTQVARQSPVRLSVSAATVAPVRAVVGANIRAAVARLRAAGLRPRLRIVASTRPRGTVVSQTPGAGTTIPKGSVVILRVSRGTAVVPDLVGQTASDAKAALAGAGLSASVFEVPSADPKGTVEAQRPAAGEKVARGSKVRINVSNGSQTTSGGTTTTATTGTTGTTTTSTTSTAPVTAPRVVGLQQSVAQRRIQAAGLRAQVVYVASSAPSGQVISQTPAAGSKARRGSKERLSASTGPAAATKPVSGVKGQGQKGATQALQAAGFTVQVLTVPVTDPNKDGVVIDEQPAGSIRAPSGSSVAIYVGRVRR
jgi:beta-lactam-binding protein with PASTA domain